MEEDIDQNSVLTGFKESLKQNEDGRYEVSLPWKPGGKERLINNENLAKLRLKSLSKRLEKNHSLCSNYDQVILDMEKTGVVEEVPLNEVITSNPVFYMPHRPVVRESAISSKIRPVFDASAKGYNGVSLNDCMEVGPCLLGNLTEILLRFRRWGIALTADIEKAFLQIAVKKEDCDVHRFLWETDGMVKTMRFRRIPFGNCASPFLLIASLNEHFRKYPQTLTLERLKEDMYMDDLLTGADSISDSCSIMSEASIIMNEACMSLAKFRSNSPAVGEVMSLEFGDKCLNAEAVKVLGLTWVAALDCFAFCGSFIPEGLVVTKRIVLSLFSKLFDPLGLAAPFIMTAKCLFQELWSLRLTWDEEVPFEHKIRFLRWVDELEVLQQWRVPRCYTPTGWSSIRQVQLHGFGDASPKGYGSCVYLKAQMSNGDFVSSLVIAKARVAPLKCQTLPRLELLGCLLCARLLKFVREALRLPVDISYYCWTDSMIALSWIQSDPNRWKAFVANRVSEIQNLTHPDNWFHCPGIENPADLLTRGMCAEELARSTLWLHGPEFVLNETFSEADSLNCNVHVTAGEEETADVTLVCSVEKTEPVFNVDRWGTLTKAIRVVAWVFRFLFNVRTAAIKRITGDLTFQELQSARSSLILCVQQHDSSSEFSALKQGLPVPKTSPLAKLRVFLAEDGLLRMQGRLQFSSLTYNEKHPIILQKGHFAVLLVRAHHLLMKHAGVQSVLTSLRNEYWILGVRRLAKRVKRFCISCQRFDSLSCQQPVPPLPRLRVNQAVAFAVMGLDHAGPVFCSDFPRKKFWVLLCTCAVTRAVHFELVESLSTQDTVLALRRLAARRGVPSCVYSDNAKGFTAAPQLLQKQFGHLAPEWRFIAPRSPWWGGWWERLVRSLKCGLRKTVGNSLLSRVELETTIQEVEAVVNSRPLTFVSDEVDGDNPLTPAHFLLGHSRGFYSTGVCQSPVNTSEELSDKLELRKTLLDQFWTIWTSDYIRNLPPGKGISRSFDLQLGSVVLIQDDRSPRLKWPLGVITKLFPGKDGVVRTVELKTTSGKLIRSIQRIHDLEIVSGSSSDVISRAPTLNEQNKCDTENNELEGVKDIDSVNQTDPLVTRSGRRVKPRVKLDL